jgi:hypothetical protein
MTEKQKISELYPQWLIDNGFGDWFEWKNGMYSTFDKFLEFATLHDSYWCGLFNYLDNSVNLILSFDAFWNQEIANHSGSKVKDWPYLIIKLEKVYNITFDSNLDCGYTIGDVKSELVNEQQKEDLIAIFERQKVLNSRLVENLIESKIIKTRIEDVCGGFIEILHQESIRLLLIDANGLRIELPTEMKILKTE